MAKMSFIQYLLEITLFENVKMVQILVRKKYILAVLSIFCSCIMDIKEAPFCIKNGTDDTLLINLSVSDTLADWTSWSELDDIFPNDTDNVDMAFTKAIIDCLALPNTNIYVSPDVYCFKDTCYIYVVERNVAGRYSMEEIRSMGLYKRRTVTKKCFHNRLYIYRGDSVADYKIQ